MSGLSDTDSILLSILGTDLTVWGGGKDGKSLGWQRGYYPLPAWFQEYGSLLGRVYILILL